MMFSSHKKFWGKIGLLAGLTFFLLVFMAIFIPIDRGSAKETMFSIEKGEGSRDIAYNLQMQGLTRSGPFLRLYVLTTGVSHKLQAGDYLLSPSLSLFDIVQKFTTGDTMQEKLTIIEGWTIEDIENYFAPKGRIINIPQELEGYLFPDTYHIRPNASNGEIIAMMRSNFEKKLNGALRQEIAKQRKTIHEIITMASLLEKELQAAKDKALASGVLWKRLQYGIALQVDAAPDTYKYRGLPPSPIANPGIESILAALYPTENPYLYYLSAPDGTTIFSKTLEEHNIAKAKYLK